MSGKDAVREFGVPYSTLAEIAKALGISKQKTAVKAKKKHWPYKEVPHPGHSLRLYPLKDLPEPIRQAVTILRARALPVPLSPHYEAKTIPEKAHQTGLCRFQLHGHWQQYRRKASTNKARADKAFLAAYNSGQSHPAIFEVLGKVSRSSLFRWEAQLKEADGDYRVLCDHRGWAPAENIEGNISPQAREVFLGLYLTAERLSVQHAYRATCAILEQRGLPVPSLSTVYRFIRRYTRENQDQVVLMREGEKALADKVAPFITRDDRQLEVGDVLFADGHRLNFDAINPMTGRPARMSLILWQDWASRMPVGWEVMPEEDTIAIASALKMAVTNLGKYPRVVYIDNGKAFRGAYFSHTSADEMQRQTQGLFNRLGIAVQYSRPYQARTKIIERFFGTLNEQFERLLPSYRGASIADKPAHLLRNEKFHQDRHDPYVPTIPEVVEVFQQYLGWYCQQPHKGLGGRRPGEVFAAGRGPGVDSEQLNWEFMWRKEVRPRRCRVRLAGIDFESDALYGLDMPLVAYFAWNDLSQIHLYERDGARRYLGVARPVEALHPVARHLGGELDLAKVKQANKRLARFKKQTMQLARETETPPELVEVWPWMGKPERVLLPEIKPSGQAPSEAEQPVSISDAERLEIEEAQRSWAARKKDQPPYERPQFNKPLERYGHLFELKVFQGVDLLPEDLQFMTAYENSDEYPAVSRRFDQLMKLAQREEAHA